MWNSWRRYGVFSALILLLCIDSYAHARSYRQPPLSSATIIRDPKILSWQKKSDTVHYTSTFTLLFRIAYPGETEETRFRLSLEPNHDLFQGGVVEYINSEGRTTRTEEIIRHEHKVYKGEAYVRDEETKSWRHCGWARITILQDGAKPLFEGVFLHDRDINHLKLLSKYMIGKEEADVGFGDDYPEDTLVVYRDSDRYISQARLSERALNGYARMEESNVSMCGHDQLEFNMQRSDQSFGSGWNLFGRLRRRQSDIGGSLATGGSRSALAATIGDTNGCSATRRVALVAGAADCGYVTTLGNSSAARSHIISIYNQASAVYETQLNISLGLSNIVISDSQCPSTPPSSAPWNVACNSSFDMNNDLSTFSAWRGERGNDGVALWTLFTGCSSGSEVGVAWLGMLCQYNAQSQGGQSVSGTNVVSYLQDDWKVLAHELGHGFGAYHDCTASVCATTQVCCPLTATTCDANQQYIMNPTTDESTNQFSPCTIGNICSGFASKQVSTSCLTSNKNVTLITAGECGNGIVEDGEECDCGGTAGCGSDKCCDPTTCKFSTGSVCDDANDACCQNCQFAPSTKVCRASANAICDPAEYCTGNSSACPSDKTTPDGTDCGNGLQCASGSCTSRDLQCQQTVNGSSGACDSTSCTLTCASSSLGPNTCLVVQQNYIDGTPCGYGGTCQTGVCDSGSTGAAISSWFQQNKLIVIIVASVLGALLLACLLSCLWRRFRSRKGAAIVPPNRQMPYPPAPPQRRAPPPPPPRDPSMTYYPGNPPAYGPQPPPYNPENQAYEMQPRSGRMQQPGEEWVRGSDGSFYPQEYDTSGVTRPTQARRPAYNRNYWEN